MRLRAEGGLCNRISAILGYRAKHGPLEVIWPIEDPIIHGTHFDELFEPLDGVTFVGSGAPDATDYAPPRDLLTGWEGAYRELVPRAGVVRMSEPYDAVHIRRTDFHGMVKKYHGVSVPTDDEILTWTHASDRPIWIATDNSETQARWRERLQERARFWQRISSGLEEQGEHDRRRHTTLTHAVVDLFMCAGAERFMGSTAHSTFTLTIERLRALR